MAILRFVARPPRLLGAVREYTNVVLVVSVLGYMLSLNGLVAMVIFMLGQPVAVWLTRRDPDFLRIRAARRLVKRAAALDGEPGNWYSGS